MSENKHTPGPWVVAEYSKKRFGLGQDGKGAFFLLHCTNDDVSSPAAQADAFLIREAPAMHLALQMILAGVARLERKGGLDEFCFGGMRYVLTEDWTKVLRTIGWTRAREAVAKATGATS